MIPNIPRSKHKDTERREVDERVILPFHIVVAGETMGRDATLYIFDLLFPEFHGLKWRLREFLQRGVSMALRPMYCVPPKTTPR
jgi:hypothetical protein